MINPSTTGKETITNVILAVVIMMIGSALFITGITLGKEESKIDNNKTKIEENINQNNNQKIENEVKQ